MSDEFEPPASVYFSTDDTLRLEDDHSELTGSNFGRRCSISLDGGLKKAEYLRLKLGASCNYHSSTSLLKELNPTTATGNADDEHEELLQMKLDMVKQQEKIDDIASKLENCELETEILLAERAALIDEIARPSAQQLQRQTLDDDGSQELVAVGSVVGDKCSMQLLRDANAQLMSENARLQVVANITRKSLKKHMEDTRLSSTKNNERLKTLEQENELLKKQPGLDGLGLDILGLDVSAKDFLSKSTNTTSPLDASGLSIENCNLLSNEETSFCSSDKSSISEEMTDVDPIFNGFLTISNGTGTDDDPEKPKPMVGKGCETRDIDQLSTQLSSAVEKFKERYIIPRRKSDNFLLVEFGESEPGEPKPRKASTRVPPRRWPSITEGIMSELTTETDQQGELTPGITIRRKSEDLLVEFGETACTRRGSTGACRGNATTGRRARSTARSWNSLKF